jgi:hypothetical protein
MSVAADIVEDLGGPAERRLGVDHPFGAPGRFEERVPGFKIGEGLECAVDASLIRSPAP